MAQWQSYKSKRINAVPYVGAKKTSHLEDNRHKSILQMQKKSDSSEANNFSSPIQLQKYEIEKSFPLDTQVKEKEPKDAWIKYIDALRRKFPFLRPLEASEKGDNNLSDIARGTNFLEQKAQLKARFEANGDKNIPIKSAHVAGIDMRPRQRVGTLANRIKKIVPRIKWIGAHLIKDAWGGLDNMMNVVAWPEEAEKIWSEGFEDPIDDAFLHGTADKAHMTIKVAKEDEAIPRVEANEELARKIPGGIAQDKTKLLHADTEKTRWEINKAIETVPELAFGVSTINRGPVHLNQGATGFHNANVLSRHYLSETINDKISKINTVSAAAVTNAKTQDEIHIKETGDRTKERKAAIIAERKNLIPDIFHQNIENIGEHEY